MTESEKKTPDIVELSADPKPATAGRLLIASIWILAPFALMGAVGFFAWPWVKSMFERFYQ